MPDYDVLRGRRPEGAAAIFTGAGWSAPQPVDPSVGLSGIACPAAGFCVAVGSSGIAYELHGTSWGAGTAIDSPDSLPLGVSCAAVDLCVVVTNTGDAITGR